METNELAIIDKPDLVAVANNIRGISENTRFTYIHAVESYLRYLQENKLDLGLDSMQSWLSRLESPKTQNVYLQAVKRVLREIYENDIRLLELEKVFKKLKVVKTDNAVKENKYLTFRDFQKLVRRTPEKYGLIIESLYWTGCRISELTHIKLKDCAKLKGVYTITIVGKGSKQRDVFMTDTLFNRVKEVFNSSVYLFEHNGKSYNRSYLSGKIKQFGRKVLNREISAHTLRHSKVMYLKDEKKLSPDQIQKALGHQDVSTTLTHYFHGTPTAKDQGIK